MLTLFDSTYLQSRKYPYVGRSVTLILDSVVFPNRTVNKNWYIGGKGLYIFSMHFKRADFVTIETDAFSSPSLQRVTELAFEEQHLLQFANGWARDMTLNALKFTNCIFIDYEHNFFGRNFISKVVMSNLTIKRKKIVDLFGIGNRNDLFIIRIENSRVLRHINAYDFSATFSVRYLFLPHCGIESITTNAFNYMIDLIEIDLSGNRLKTLPAGIFNVLLEKRYFVAVNLSHNHWECQCNLVRVQTALQEYGIAFKDFPVNCTLPREPASKYDRICRSDTELMEESTCRAQYGFNFIFVTMPRIPIHIDDALEEILISVQSNRTEPIYLLAMHQLNSNECQVKQLPACYRLLPQNASAITIPNLPTQINSIFCILYSKKSMNSIWPINCMSICKNCKIRIWLRISSLMWFLPAMIFLFVATIVLGMGLGYYLLRYRPQLLIGAGRVVVLRNPTRERRHSFTIFVMPSNWQENTQRYVYSFVYMHYSIYIYIYTASDSGCKYNVSRLDRGWRILNAISIYIFDIQLIFFSIWTSSGMICLYYKIHYAFVFAPSFDWIHDIFYSFILACSCCCCHYRMNVVDKRDYGTTKKYLSNSNENVELDGNIDYDYYSYMEIDFNCRSLECPPLPPRPQSIEQDRFKSICE